MLEDRDQSDSWKELVGTDRKLGFSGKSAWWGARVHVEDTGGLLFYNVYSFLTSTSDTLITSLSSAFSVDEWRVVVHFSE